MPSSRYYRFKTINKKDRIKKVKVFAFWLSILIVFLILVWAIFLSPLFKIRYINTSDNNYLNSNNVNNIISKIAPFKLGENLLVVSKYQLKSKLAGAFPNITDITVKKELFHTLIIDFQKRIQIGIWCKPKADSPETDNCYYFDKYGIAFAEAPETEGSLILKIEDGSKNNANLGDQVLSNNQINFIISFINKINEDNELKILEFKIKPDPSIDFEAITDKNWPIYLDEKQDPKAAADNLLTILKEVIKNTNNVEYIDLRIPDRIYYKLK